MSERKTIGFRMAKASTQDLDAAFALAGILDSLARGHYPTGGKDQCEDAPTYFDRDDIDHLQHLHELLCGIEQRGSLFRVAGGLSTLLSDANGIVDPDDECIALHPRIKDALSQQPAAVDGASPLDEWHEDDGPVVWWKFPVDEPAWIGTPLDSDWPGYHTHWTPHPAVPALAAQPGGVTQPASGGVSNASLAQPQEPQR